VEGQNRGRSGHQLMSDPKVGLLGGSGIVGGSVPVGTGQALAFKMRKHPAMVCSFFGDGAVNIGHVHESLNLAALWKLPIVYVCDHNQYGLTVHASQQIAIEDVVIRAPGYGMPGLLVDGNDALAVFDAVAEARDRALSGGGPTLIEAKTYRLRGFSTGDLGGYQPEADIAAWRTRDPIPRMRGVLIIRNAAREEEVVALEAEVRQEVASALEYAQQAPDPGPEELQRWAWLS
jgi:pyruvate dehydrogenase E1 component alpha subunit